MEAAGLSKTSAVPKNRLSIVVTLVSTYITGGNGSTKMFHILYRVNKGTGVLVHAMKACGEFEA
jgi:hypothetical protein